jgi:hypothetical protein
MNATLSSATAAEMSTPTVATTAIATTTPVPRSRSASDQCQT